MDTARRHHPTGFSLTELVISLGIIAVLAAIATPRYARSLAHYRVERAAYRIVADLNATRTLARTTGSSRTVAFSTTSHRYQISSSSSSLSVDASLSSSFSTSSSSKSTNAINLADEPYGVEIASASLGADASVIFNAYGIPDSGGTVVLQCGAIQKTISLDGNTAKATVN